MKIAEKSTIYCPGCGSKCSRPEPHDEELVEEWHECQCAPQKCTCEQPKPRLLNVHSTSHHIAKSFYGMMYYKKHTPFLKLCYQQWKTSGITIDDNIKIFPRQKFYQQYRPQWYNNLHLLSTEGIACDEEIPPLEQRRAWMIVRHVLVSHYADNGMVDEQDYNKKLYPSNVDALSASFKPSWNDIIDELAEIDEDNSTLDDNHQSSEDETEPIQNDNHELTYNEDNKLAKDENHEANNDTNDK